MSGTKHKVFISFFHEDDEKYKIALERHFDHLMISKSVGEDEINADTSAEYIKRLIREDFISDASVVVVLMGPNTLKRKHVDWEISAGLSGQAGGPSGLLGVILPEFPLETNGNCAYANMPPRLADNLKTDYAPFPSWETLTRSESNFTQFINQAFNNRVNLKDKIDNSRIQMQRNIS